MLHSSKFKMVLLMCSLLSVVACGAKVKVTKNLLGGPDDKPKVEEIKAGVLDGVVKGDSWTFMSGRAKVMKTSTGERTLLEFWEESVSDPCNAIIVSGKRKLLSGITLASGIHNLGNQENVTFSYMQDNTSENFVATEGKIIIDEIANGTVSGRLATTYDKNHSVNGSFKLTYCK